jgi:glycosyltransferase involved in cell wall biosynthesis
MIDRLNRAGTETQLLALIHHLDRQRVRPFLCLLDGTDAHSRSLELSDCPIVRLGVRSLRHPSTLTHAIRLGRFLAQHRIDVLQVYFADSTYLGTVSARLVGVPFVVRTRNNLGYWLTPVHRRLGRLCSRFAAATVANSEACRRAVIADEGPRPSSVVVIENGVDLPRFAHLPAPFCQPDLRRVGILANLRAVKNLALFVETASQVALGHPQVRFLIAGEGELRPDLQRAIWERGLADRFTLPGFVSDAPAFLGKLDVAVLCSHSEGMSNALLEYMAAGRPIAATSVGGNPELIEDGVHGLLVPPGDSSALAKAIDRLLTNPALAVQLGHSARLRAQQRYGRLNMVRRFEEFYARLVFGSDRSLVAC